MRNIRMRELMRIVESTNRILNEEGPATPGQPKAPKPDAFTNDELWQKISKFAKDNNFDSMSKDEQEAALEKEFGNESPKLKKRDGTEVPFSGKILKKILSKKMMTPAMQQSRSGAYSGADSSNLDKATLQAFKKELSDAFATSGRGKVAAIKAVLEDERFTSKDFKKAIKSGLQDGDADDDKVKIEGGKKVSNKLLRPTQGFIDFGKSVSYNFSNSSGFQGAFADPIDGGGEIAVAPVEGGQYIILDGHHRWSGGACANPEGNKSAIIYTFQTDKHRTADAAGILGQMQLAIAGQTTPGQALPSAGGKADNDIMKADAKRMYQLFVENMGKALDGQGPLMSDEWCQEVLQMNEIWSQPAIKNFQKASKIAEVPKEAKPLSEAVANGKIVCPFRHFMASYASYNWGTVLASTRTQIDGTPKQREDMPQLDNALIDGDEGYAAVKAGLEQGKVQTHFDNIDDIIEASENDGDLLLERWGKLAGLL